MTLAERIQSTRPAPAPRPAPVPEWVRRAQTGRLAPKDLTRG